MKKPIITLFIALCIAFSATAQQNKKLSTEVITVEKGYNASVSKSEKASLSPEEAPRQSEKLSVDYSSTTQNPKSSYQVEPIKPLILQNSQSTDEYPNYIKLGVGVKSSTMFDAFYNISKGKHSFTAIVTEDAAKRDIKDIEDKALFYHSGVQLDYTYALRGYNLQFTVKNQTNSYSNQNSKPLYSKFKNNTISAQAAIRANAHDKVFEGAAIGISHYKGNGDSKETALSFETGFNVPISDRLAFVIDADAQYYNTTFNTLIPADNKLFVGRTTPAVTFKTDRFDLFAGVQIAGLHDSRISDNKFHVMPEIKAAYSLVDGLTSIYARFTSGYKVHSLDELSSENPFMNPSQEPIYSLEKYNAEIGISGVFSSKLRYDLQIGYNSMESRPNWLYIGSGYIAYAQDVNIFKILASADYTINKDHRVSAFAQFNNADTDSQYSPTYLPALRIGASYRANILEDRVTLFGRAVFNSSSKALYALSSDPLGIDFDAFLEYQASATFKVSKRFDVFLEVNNTINSSVPNFYGYKSIGVRGIVGVKFNF